MPNLQSLIPNLHLFVALTGEPGWPCCLGQHSRVVWLSRLLHIAALSPLIHGIAKKATALSVPIFAFADHFTIGGVCATSAQITQMGKRLRLAQIPSICCE